MFITIHYPILSHYRKKQQVSKRYVDMRIVVETMLLISITTNVTQNEMQKKKLPVFTLFFLQAQTAVLISITTDALENEVLKKAATSIFSSQLG